MFVIAPVDRKVEKQPHPQDETTSTKVEYIDDATPVKVKSSQYYRRKIADGNLILITESDTLPKNWDQDLNLHPTQRDRIKAAEKEARIKKAADKKAADKKAAEAQKTTKPNKAKTNK